jgi:hypothetical protein
VRGPTGIRFQRSAEVMSRRVGTDVLVAIPAEDEVHELSGGANAVWSDLKAPRTVVDLVERLAVAHGTEPSEIEGQVVACLDTLLHLGVVEEVQDFDA